MATANRFTLQPAVVLHHRPYRDSSAIVDLFTPEQGRIAVVARGVRKQNSRLQGLVQVFQPLLISWSGRGELGTLNKIEAQGSPYKLTGTALISGLYINELLVRLLHRHEAHVELFSAYNRVLDGLQHLPAEDAQHRHLQCLLRNFELSLLQDLGYALQLDCDAANGEAIHPTSNYHYHIEQGPVRVTSDSVADNYLMEIAGKTLICLAGGLDEQLHDDQILKQAKQLMRVVLDYYLGSRPIHSRQLFSGYNPAALKPSASGKDLCDE